MNWGDPRTPPGSALGSAGMGQQQSLFYEPSAYAAAPYSVRGTIKVEGKVLTRMRTGSLLHTHRQIPQKYRVAHGEDST